MIRIHRFENQLLSSFCYLVLDENAKRCIIIDPGSEKSEKEIDFLCANNLTLDFILITHEHIDHLWGVNSLMDRYPASEVVCSSRCRDNSSSEVRHFFQLYFDVPNYSYSLKRVDRTTEDIGWCLTWLNHCIKFYSTPGHTPGSICIDIDGILFGGDSLLLFKPFVRKPKGDSLKQFKDSVRSIKNSYPEFTIVYPGHGEVFRLRDLELKE